MEVTYKGSKYPDIRPDGLAVCTRGKTVWSAFIEAKAEKSIIRPEQIQDYVKLADLAEVDAIITISNEFAREPDELPYHLTQNKRRSKGVFHFAWADIRTFLELEKASGTLADAEQYVLKQCLEYFWDDVSGIQTYDAMPETWAAFVESSSTALGFNSKVKGFSEIIAAWQQERRDLCSKLTRRLGGQVQLRHDAGVRANEEMRLMMDRKNLADDYVLTAQYYFRSSKTSMKICADLRACRITATLEIPLPENKGAKAMATWLSQCLGETPQPDLTLVFDWPRKNNDISLAVSDFLAEPTLVSDQRKDAPRSIQAIISKHDVRRFKGRKAFIAETEQIISRLIDQGLSAKWIR